MSYEQEVKEILRSFDRQREAIVGKDLADFQAQEGRLLTEALKQLQRCKLFHTGDTVKVKDGCKDHRGEYAGRLGIITNDTHSTYYPYLVEFFDPNPHNKAYFARSRPFRPISLELVKSGTAVGEMAVLTEQEIIEIQKHNFPYEEAIAQAQLDIDKAKVRGLQLDIESLSHAQEILSKKLDDVDLAIEQARQETARGLHDWGQELCHEHYVGNKLRRECDNCWQTLKEGVKK